MLIKHRLLTRAAPIRPASIFWCDPSGEVAAPIERDLILESTMRKRMALLLLAACCAQAAQRFDVVVYGATAGGTIAA